MRGERIYFRDLQSGKMIRKWFSRAAGGYNDFIKALLLDDIKGMNIYK